MVKRIKKEDKMAIIYTYPVKATPNANDLILISDSQDSNKTKQVKIASLPGGSGSGVSSVTSANAAITVADASTTPVLTSVAYSGGAGIGHVPTGSGSSSAVYLDGTGNWSTPASTSYSAGDGIDLTGTTFSVDLKANGGLAIESTKLAVDLGASSITGALAVGNGGTGLSTLTSGAITRGNGTSALVQDDYLIYNGTTKSLNIRGTGNTNPSSLGATLNIMDAQGAALGSENCISLEPSGGQGARGININMGSYNEGIKILRTHTNASTAMNFSQSVSGNTNVGSISLTNLATSFNTSSDHRLKENVIDMTGAVDRVKQLKPKRFNFTIDPGITFDGFLAHEAQAVVPESVTGTKDEVDNNGNAVYQGIDQAKLVPLLVGAIKELTARIEALEA